MFDLQIWIITGSGDDEEEDDDDDDTDDKKETYGKWSSFWVVQPPFFKEQTVPSGPGYPLLAADSRRFSNFCRRHWFDLNF